MTECLVTAPRIRTTPYFDAGLAWFPVHHMRGGTSTGLILQDDLAPRHPDLREELLRHLMGVPQSGSHKGNRQITGLGRGYPTSNKVFFVSAEHKDGCFSVTSTLAQLAADHAAIDWSVNCGNMSSAIPLWLTDLGWFPAGERTGEVDIHNTNTGIVTTARMEREVDGKLTATAIPGVEGEFPQVDLFLNDPVGSKTGTLLPTRKAMEDIDGCRISCVDVTVPMVICNAHDLGKTGYEPIEELAADPTFMARIRSIWVEAGLRMNLKKANGALMSAEELSRSETIPKVCIVAPPRGNGTISARYFTPQAGHPSLAVSGGCCLAAACLIPGTVAHALAVNPPKVTSDWSDVEVFAEHPAGTLDATITAKWLEGHLHIRRAGYRRNAQVLLRGHVPLYRASAALLQALRAAIPASE